MIHRLLRRQPALAQVFCVWLLLVAITLVSALERSAIALGFIAVLTALKVALVIFDYMEVGRAPLWLKLACMAWIVLAIGVVSVLLVFPQPIVALVRHAA
ncbi:MAG: cytochrome C oxidase subunit IV family protein [Pseudomonadota bacterium]